MKTALFVALYTLFLCSNVSAKPNVVDKKLPVEVTSDSLEVIQDKQRAIFSGNVIAKHGDVNIRADKMIVYYIKKDEKSDGGQDSVSKVEAEGNVFMSTPNETVQGQTGSLDVAKNLVTLGGNVTLTSGKNVVKGEKLVYNVTTGQSRLIGSAGGSGTDTTKKGRVRGVFIPKQ